MEHSREHLAFVEHLRVCNKARHAKAAEERSSTKSTGCIARVEKGHLILGPAFGIEGVKIKLTDEQLQPVLNYVNGIHYRKM